MSNSKRKDKSRHLDYNKTAQSIFNAAESLGVTERSRIDEIIGKVISRLEISNKSNVPLPGMEELVSDSAMDTDKFTTIQQLVKEVIMETKNKADIVINTNLKEEKPNTDVRKVIRTMQVKNAVKLTPNAMTVLEKRYLGKDKQGKVIEKVDDMFRRVARNIASAEALFKAGSDSSIWEDEFYNIMVDLDFLPNSPTLMNAGRDLQQLSACFVLPIEDSMESIFDAVKYTALIHKSGGGTGFSFSKLRPENDPVGSTGGVASGPVSFMRAFDTATDVIKQGGTRRGANMAILNVDHPDILKFIHAKEDSKALNNFNLSVALTENFMKAVENNVDYELINPATKKVVRKINAKTVFDQIVDMSWRTGDPGIVFIDRINSSNATPNMGRIESTNPCGEQPLLPYESCNLGSINLANMLENGKINWEKLEKTTRIAVRFLDNVIEVNKFPLELIENMTRKTRKIGLGVMGFADMLIKMGIQYDSERGLRTAEDVMRFVTEKATDASVELAKERGVFPAFKGSIYDNPGSPQVRNATRTTIAPTGTLSIIAGCSSGIEPVFALSYTRNILDGAQLIEVHPIFEEAARKDGFYSDDLIKELAKSGSLSHIDGIPDRLKRIFVTAHDITPEWHIKMQAAFQRYTDNAVSKTVNFPHEATPEDIARVYILAYKECCKGVTIYRDRSRDQQVLTLDNKTEEQKKEKAGLTPRSRPKVTVGTTYRIATGCGNIYITVNSDEHGICEVFSHLGKAGGCASAQLEAICRLISLSLRAGVDAASVIKHLRGIRCPALAWEDGHSIMSCPDAIGSVLEKHINECMTDMKLKKPELTDSEVPKLSDGINGNGNGKQYNNVAGLCPDCGGMLIYQEGCLHCSFCGYSKC